MLGVQEVVIKGGIDSNASFILLLCQYCIVINKEFNVTIIYDGRKTLTTKINSNMVTN
jgi:hypothetical protein